MTEIQSIHPEGETASVGEPIGVSFTHIVQSYFLQALIGAGEIQNPITGKQEKDLNLSRFHISNLEVLEEKTKGNLDAEEANVLAECLSRARLAFVKATSAGPEETKEEDKSE